MQVGKYLEEHIRTEILKRTRNGLDLISSFIGDSELTPGDGWKEQFDKGFLICRILTFEDQYVVLMTLKLDNNDQGEEQKYIRLVSAIEYINQHCYFFEDANMKLYKQIDIDFKLNILKELIALERKSEVMFPRNYN